MIDNILSVILYPHLTTDAPFTKPRTDSSAMHFSAPEFQEHSQYTCLDEEENYLDPEARVARRNVLYEQGLEVHKSHQLEVAKKSIPT